MNAGKTIPPPAVADVGMGYVGRPMVVPLGKRFRTNGVPRKADAMVAAVCHKCYLERPLTGFLDLFGPVTLSSIPILLLLSISFEMPDIASGGFDHVSDHQE